MKTVKIIAWAFAGLMCAVSAIAGIITIVTKGNWWIKLYEKIIDAIYNRD